MNTEQTPGHVRRRVVDALYRKPFLQLTSALTELRRLVEPVPSKEYHECGTVEAKCAFLAQRQLWFVEDFVDFYTAGELEENQDARSAALVMVIRQLSVLKKDLGTDDTGARLTSVILLLTELFTSLNTAVYERRQMDLALRRALASRMATERRNCFWPAGLARAKVHVMRRRDGFNTVIYEAR